jgi:hypothetical protein
MGYIPRQVWFAKNRPKGRGMYPIAQSEAPRFTKMYLTKVELYATLFNHITRILKKEF